MNGSKPVPYIPLKLTNDDVTVIYGDDRSMATTVNGSIGVSTTGDANGNAVVNLPGLAAFDVTITNNAFQITKAGTTMDFRSQVDDLDVAVNGVITPIVTLIDQFVIDVNSGNAATSWHIHSQLLMAAMVTTSTPAWRANTVTSQYKAGAPLMWRKVSAITGAAGVYSMSSISCTVVFDACDGKEAIDRGGVSLLTSVLTPSCFAGDLDSASKCYQYVTDIWN